MYYVTHPQGPIDNLPPENILLAVDELNNEAGRGRVIYQYTPHMDPECPVNLYFDMKSSLGARYVLLGALMARARQLREIAPDVPARVYTIVDPRDTESQAFYTSAGMSLQNGEMMVELKRPEYESRIPMGAEVIALPLNTDEEKLAFLTRLSNNDIRHIDFSRLQQFCRSPHFQLLGMVRDNQVVSELMMVGNGDTCELMGIYTHSAYRRQGLARALVHRSMEILSMENANRFVTRVMTRSGPQMGLMHAFQAQELEMIALFPEMTM